MGKSKPGPGWYFDHITREWVEITEEEKEAARVYVERGFSQTSAKYRGVGLFDRSVRPWKEIESADLTPGVFASFREQAKADQELQAYRAREARRPRAKRLVEILRLLSDARAEELLLDLMAAHSSGSWVEFDYAREVGLEPPLGVFAPRVTDFVGHTVTLEMPFHQWAAANLPNPAVGEPVTFDYADGARFEGHVVGDEERAGLRVLKAEGKVWGSP